MQLQQEMSSVQQWHILYLVKMGQDLYSHDFLDLLVGKMEATLEGKITNVWI